MVEAGYSRIFEVQISEVPLYSSVIPERFQSFNRLAGADGNARDKGRKTVVKWLRSESV